MLDVEKFDLNNLSITKVDFRNEFSYSQGLSYVNYKYPDKTDMLIIKTGPIKMTQYGIPKLSQRILNSYRYDQRRCDMERSFIRIPFDVDQPNSVKLFQVLRDIDEFMVRNKATFLNHNPDLHHKYTYVPLIKQPFGELESDQEDNKGKDGKKRFQYCSLKLPLDETNSVLISPIIVNDGYTDIQIHPKTVSELEWLIRRNVTLQFVMSFNKVWFSKMSKMKGSLREYGIKMNCVVLYICSKYNEIRRDVKLQTKNTFYVDSTKQHQSCINFDKIAFIHKGQSRNYKFNFSFMSYDFSNGEVGNLVIKVPPILIKPFKFLRKEGRYGSDMNHVFIPFDELQANSVLLFNILENLDDFIKSSQMSIFSGSDLDSDSYEYVPFVRKSDDVPTKYCKISVDTCPYSYHFNDTRSIILGNNCNDLNGILNQDVFDWLAFNKKSYYFSFIMSFSMIWFNNNFQDGDKYKKFGLANRCLVLYISDEADCLSDDLISQHSSYLYKSDSEVDVRPSKISTIFFKSNP